MAQIRVDIVTPDGVIFSDMADTVMVPTPDGYIGIKAGHIRLMTRVQLGLLRIKRGNNLVLMAVSDGYMEVMPDKVIILGEAAEIAGEMDAAAALDVRKRAIESEVERDGLMSMAKAQAAIQRAMNNVKAASAARARRGDSIKNDLS